MECAQGFARTHSPDFNPERALAAPPRGMYCSHNLFKYHAACYMTHAPIEAARKLREQHGLTPGQVAEDAPPAGRRVRRICNIPAPRTGLEAKFSLRLTTAMALAGIDTGALASYSEANARRPALVALRDRVDLDFQSGWPNTLAEIELELPTDAARGAPRRRHPEPRHRRPGTPARAEILPPSSSRCSARAPRRLADAANRLDALDDVRGMLALCR